MNRFVLSDGSSIVYRDEGVGRPLLLLHGWGVSSALFERQFQNLCGDFRLIAPNLRGHGESVAFHEGQEFTRLADDIQELIAHLALQGTVLVGWSMGAMVAWDLLSRTNAPDISGLVTIDMVPCLLNQRGWDFGLRTGSDARVFDRALKAMRADWPRFTRVFVPRIFTGKNTRYGMDGVDRVCAIAARNDPESMARLWSCLVEQDFRTKLRGIDVPALVMCGAESQLYRIDASHWVVENMHDARLKIFSRAGHAPQLERADAFNQALGNFVHRLADPGGFCRSRIGTGH